MRYTSKFGGRSRSERTRSGARRRPGRRAIDRRGVGHACRRMPLRVHRVDLEIAVAIHLERDASAVGGKRRRAVLSRRRRQRPSPGPSADITRMSVSVALGGEHQPLAVGQPVRRAVVGGRDVFSGGHKRTATVTRPAATTTPKIRRESVVAVDLVRGAASFDGLGNHWDWGGQKPLNVTSDRSLSMSAI